MIATFRQRNFALLWFSGTISMIGDWMLFIGLPIFVYTLTGSTLATGITFIIETLPSVLLSSLAGVFVDRWDRKRIMIAGDALRAIAVLLLLTVHTPEQIWIVYAVAGVMALVSQFATPAVSALLPNLVDDEHLVVANSLISSSTNLTRLIGPAIGGGLVVALGFSSVILIDSASFVISALLVALIAMRRAQASAPAKSGTSQLENWIGIWREWWEGLQFVRKDRTIVAIFLIIAAAMPAEGILRVVFVVFVNRLLGGGAWEYGLITSAQAIGGLVGSLAIARLGQTTRLNRLIGVSGMVNGLLLLIIFTFPSLPLALALFLLAGLPVVGFFVSLTTLLQMSVPDQYRGRVFGSFGTTVALMTLAGMGFASALGDLLGTQVMLSAVAGLNILAGLIAIVLLRSIVAKTSMPIELEAV